ncbi:MAG: hypothetical protein M1824_002312 [Vezdaea acicularis]|nr:MAG: hypothetical protein M1824_002312 [Vezdaea acicularis]
MQHANKTHRYLTTLRKKSSSLGFLISSYIFCAMRRRDSTTDRADAGTVEVPPSPTPPANTDNVLLSFGPYGDTYLVSRADLLRASPIFPSLLATPSSYTSTGTPCIEWPLSSFSHQGPFPNPTAVAAFHFFVLWLRDELVPLPRKRGLEYEDFQQFRVYLDVYNLARKLEVRGLQEWVLAEVEAMLDACEDLEVPGLEHVAAQYMHRRDYAVPTVPTTAPSTRTATDPPAPAPATENTALDLDLTLQNQLERKSKTQPRTPMSSLLLTHYCTNLATEHFSRLAQQSAKASKTQLPPRTWEPWLRKRAGTGPLVVSSLAAAPDNGPLIVSSLTPSSPQTTETEIKPATAEGAEAGYTYTFNPHHAANVELGLCPPHHHRHPHPHCHPHTYPHPRWAPTVEDQARKQKDRASHRLWLYDEYPGLRLDVVVELGRRIKILKEDGRGGKGGVRRV